MHGISPEEKENNAHGSEVGKWRPLVRHRLASALTVPRRIRRLRSDDVKPAQPGAKRRLPFETGWASPTVAHEMATRASLGDASPRRIARRSMLRLAAWTPFSRLTRAA